MRLACQTAAAIVAAASQCPIGTATASGLSAVLTAHTAFADPGGLPTAARVLREGRRSRGRWISVFGLLGRAARRRADRAARLRGRRCGTGRRCPPNGGCAEARALRSCTTPDSPCPARASQRQPDRQDAWRWRPGALRTPPARADHAVPRGAAARPELLRPDRRDHRCQPAAIRQRRVRRVPRMRHPGARIAAPALRRLRPRQARGVQLQAPRLAAPRAGRGAWRRAPRIW